MPELSRGAQSLLELIRRLGHYNTSKASPLGYRYSTIQIMIARELQELIEAGLVTEKHIVGDIHSYKIK